MIIIMCIPFAPLFDGSRLLELTAEQPLFATGGPVIEMFLVVSGQVHLCRHTVHGATMVLQNAGAGAVLAEASAYSPTYHCDAVAAMKSTVRAIPKSEFLAILANEAGLAAQWSAALARGIQAARLRAEIRSLPKVTDRLDAWLGEGNTLPEKGHWQELAAELGITREALYRELAQRRAASADTNPATLCSP